jgi:hypothetical protein
MADNPQDEKWRSSKAKELLRQEIVAGNIDENSDPRTIHDSCDEFRKWPFNRFKPNLKNLIKSVREGNTKPPKWGKSQAKKLLREDIISGAVQDAMEAIHVYNSRDEYKKYDFANFKTNLANLKEAIYAAYERMGTDCEAYGHDVDLLKLIRFHDPPLPILWHKSEAKPLLEKDIDDKKHLELDEDTGKKVTPKHLYQSRPAYREYSLKVFRKHIYQEVDKRAKKDIRYKKKKKRMRAPATTVFDAPRRATE